MSAKSDSPRPVRPTRFYGGGSPLDEAAQAALAELSAADVGDVQQVAASQIRFLTTFYALVIGQARRSFFWALVASAIGLLFFLAAISFLLLANQREIAIVSVIGGALIEVIGGLNFVLYGRTTAQLGIFHSRLEITQRFLLANSLCESLDGETKTRARENLIGKLASIALAQATTQTSQASGGGT